MSWSGTVRCRHCYSNGHNRRTCPDLTETLKRRAEAENNPEGYSTRQYEKRVGHKLDGSPLAKEVKAARNPRRCTYCALRGHNRRTCETLAANKQQYVENTIAFRRQVLTAAQAVGVGVGALVSTDRWGDSHCWLITQINWNRIKMGLHDDVIVGQNVKMAAGSRSAMNHMAFPALVNEGGEELNGNRHGMSTVLGPVEVAGVPADFLTPAGVHHMLADVFDKDARSENYWENRHAC